MYDLHLFSLSVNLVLTLASLGLANHSPPFFCKHAHHDCRLDTGYFTPNSPIPANQIEVFCYDFEQFKSCYLESTKKLCPLKELDVYVERSCADVPAYKKHSGCFIKVHKESERFVKILRECHVKDPKAVEYESIPLVKRSRHQRCHMEMTEIRCSRMAFKKICNSVGAFKHFHRQGGHTSWSGNCRNVNGLGVD